MKYDRSEIKAGIFVLICIILLLGLIFKVSNFKESLQPKKEITVIFSHAGGIKLNGPVYYAGVQAGKVINIDIDENDNVYMTLQLEQGINVRRDSVIKVGSSVMGDSYIDITPGKGAIVKSGETVRGSDASIVRQIEDVVSSVKNLIESDKITSSLDNLDKTLKNVADVSGVIADDKDKLKTIIANIDTSMENIREISQTVNRDIDGITTKMDIVLSNIAEMTDEEQIEKIDEITANLVDITNNVENILVENKNSIRAITTNVESITDNLYILSADIKRHPWKLLIKSKEQDIEKYALQDAIVRLRETEKNLQILKEKNEKITEEDMEEIRALIHNLQVIEKSTKELRSEEEKSPRRKPFGR